VFVKYREGFDIPAQTAAIKSLVTNSVEGLEYDKVSIAMTEAKTPPVPLAPIGGGSWVTILAGFGAVIGIGFVALACWRAYAARGMRSGGAISRAVRDV
jgi:type III secretion protein J